MTAGLLSIGELAGATGVAPSALRHYDQMGVIAPAQRVGGKRRFDRSTVGRVNFVRRAQRFGFSLAEIGELIDDSSEAGRPMVEEKLAALRAQRQELTTLIAILEEIRTCGCHVVAECERVANPC